MCPEHAGQYEEALRGRSMEWDMGEAVSVHDHGDYDAARCTVCGTRLSRNDYTKA